MIINRARLPRTCFIDTTVILGWLGQKTLEKKAASCRRFVESMIEERRKVYVAAPSWAEVLRGAPDTPLLSPHVEVRPFDRRAAELLGREIPFTVQRATAKEHAVSLKYIKYDAMIVACAKRWDADVMIALDSDHFKLAKHVKLEVRQPSYYEDPTLFSLDEASSD